MDSFKKHEQAFEAKFARDNEAMFIVNMKACSILARDIAEGKLKLDKRATKRYCDAVLSFSVRNCHPSTLFDYIEKRLRKNNITMKRPEIEAMYASALARARTDMALVE